MQNNTALKRHMNIIRELIGFRNAKVSDVLKHNDASIVKGRIEKLKSQYISMLDTEMLKLPSRVVKAGEIECRGYRIEKLVMESLENYFVPMHLYVPDSGGEAKKPAVLVNMGHYIEGKALAENQIMCANLALHGFIVLTFDSICQGERDMFPDRTGEHWKKDLWVVEQHMKVGNQCYLLGYNSINYFLNDAKKGVDYLVSRQDVDIDRVGVTGQSGGGTLSYLIAALDERIKAVAPVHCLSTLDRICENGIGDSEQSMINMLYKGFDLADFLWMIAPRPLFISAGTGDYFSIDGVRKIYHELKKVYGILGHEKNMELCEIDVEHIINKDVRISVCNFFNSLFLQKKPFTEQNVPILSQEQLSCGIKELNGRTPLEHNKIMLEKLKAARCEKNQTIADIRKALGRVFSLNNAEFETVNDSCGGQNGYRRLVLKDKQNLNFEIEMVIKPDSPDAVVYIDLEDNAAITKKTFGNSSNTVVIKPFGGCKDSYKLGAGYDDETKLAYQGIICGKCIFELRLAQILYSLDLIRQEGIRGNIEVYGNRQGALLALFATLFKNGVSKVHCEELICSFSSLFGKKDYIINETDIIPGILKEFDIDILLKSLGCRVDLISTLNETKEVITIQQ